MELKREIMEMGDLQIRKWDLQVRIECIRLVGYAENL